ncbi:hypothetical protein [Andreprevotia chitinilytica]|uniref:hypothetical protein n=1 Tax=Andreprevotia chitinilytica TaxID=396808 RepID=UPI0005557390|nr:hypothetical protein [Andreprevotia chitinilytica]
MVRALTGLLAPFLVASMTAAAASADTPLRIEGVGQTPLNGRVKQLKVDRDHVLRFQLGEQAVQVAPWPAGLPDRLSKQQVTVSASFNPAGPVTRLSLQGAKETQPWLYLVASGPFGSQLVPGWQLRRSGDAGFSVVDQDERATPVAAGEKRSLRDSSGACWQFNLLHVDIPADQSSASEREPRADWYLRKVPRC